MSETTAVDRATQARGPLVIAFVAVSGAVFLWRSMRGGAASAAYAPPSAEVTAICFEAGRQVGRGTVLLHLFDASKRAAARIAQKMVRTLFAGCIGILRVNPGQYVDVGDPLATLTAPDRLYVNFSVPQQELLRSALAWLGIVDLQVVAAGGQPLHPGAGRDGVAPWRIAGRMPA